MEQVAKRTPQTGSMTEVRFPAQVGTGMFIAASTLHGPTTRQALRVLSCTRPVDAATSSLLVGVIPHAFSQRILTGSYTKLLALSASQII
jgi:hypothetical protein